MTLRLLSERCTKTPIDFKMFTLCTVKLLINAPGVYQNTGLKHPAYYTPIRYDTGYTVY